MVEAGCELPDATGDALWWCLGPFLRPVEAGCEVSRAEFCPEQFKGYFWFSLKSIFTMAVRGLWRLHATSAGLRKAPNTSRMSFSRMRSHLESLWVGTHISLSTGFSICRTSGNRSPEDTETLHASVDQWFPDKESWSKQGSRECFWGSWEDLV